MQEMQSQQPGTFLPVTVTFPMKTINKDNKEQLTMMNVKAGPSQFGPKISQDRKVNGRVIVTQPFRACDDLTNGNLINGKIAIMERGDCMFIDKVRRVQKYGAIAAIIIDNTPGSSIQSSPLFSMSGDGTDDIKIPAVFLFKQDATKLLLAYTKDQTIEVQISEIQDDNNNNSNNNNNNNMSEYEEESMFHKLKVSVQEFLNKHTGIVFSETIDYGNFRANIGTDKIRITLKNRKIDKPPVDTVSNPQWSQLRRSLLKSILQSKNEELYVPINILRIYYQTLSGAKAEEISTPNVVKQTEWLLNELTKEYNKNDDDTLVKADSNEQSVSVLTYLNEKEKLKSETNEKLYKELSDYLETKWNNMLKLNPDGSSTTDELILSDSKKSDNNNKNNVDTTSENNEINNDEHIKTKINHAVDEL